MTVIKDGYEPCMIVDDKGAEIASGSNGLNYDFGVSGPPSFTVDMDVKAG